MATSLDVLLGKYGEVIKEEVNVKDIRIIQEGLKIHKIYKPLGSALSAKFGKDTGAIIKWGKEGNVREQNNGTIVVFSADGQEWILDELDYEIHYEGIDASNTSIDKDIVVQLDLQITDELYGEGIAREMSRFLNQMRKEYNYQVNDKLQLVYHTSNELLDKVIIQYTDFLQDEALLVTVSQGKGKLTGDIVQDFVHEDGSIVTFALRK